MENFLTIVSKYSTHEQEQTAQTALYTIKLLAKRLAENHPTEFSTVSEHYVNIFIRPKLELRGNLVFVIFIPR